MSTDVSGFKYENYEEALAGFEAAQSLLLSRDDIGEAARMAGAFALCAREVGNLRLAEAGHRTVIAAYGMVDELEGFAIEKDSDHLVGQKVLAEYARLAETLGLANRNPKSQHKLHKLKKEILGIGPVVPMYVVDGIWALRESEESLAAVALIGRSHHLRQSQYLHDVCQQASEAGGLGLCVLVDDDLEPRSVGDWMSTIKENT